MGDLLTAAHDQLLAARCAYEPPTRPAEFVPVAQALSQVMVALTGHLDASGAVDGLNIRSSAPHLTGWPQAALVARQALAEGIRRLAPYRAMPIRRSVPLEIRELAGHLSAAAASLAAARDLLHTHFVPAPGRGRICVSEWAPVVLSEATNRALATHAAGCTRQIAPIVARLGQACTARGGHGTLATRAAPRLRACGELLWSADEVIQAANGREPVQAADMELLHSIPVNVLPGRVLPQPADPVPVLCDGIISTAERVRQATWVPAPAWSPEISDTSLRSTAAAAVVISHNCGTALETLATVAGQHGLQGLGGTLAEHASAASAARDGWLRSARAWGDSVVTDTTGTRSGLCIETGDLAWWTGRLVYADPAWSPAHGRNHAVRRPEEILPHTGWIGRLTGAVHAAAEALCRLAEAEQDRVRAIAAAGRLYVPTQMLPPEFEIPRKYGYGPAQREHITGLHAAYQAAGHDSARLAAGMAKVAAVVGAPTRALAATRACSPRAAEPPAPTTAPPHNRPRPGRWSACSGNGVSATRHCWYAPPPWTKR
jgi:hypothetical protein